MILPEFALKSFVSILVLFLCRFKVTKSVEVKCSSNSTEFCDVDTPVNGNDESMAVISTPEQNSVIGIRLTDVSNAIPKVFFQRFPGLQYAQFKAGVKAISQNDFRDANKLGELNLEGNRIKIVPKEVFIHAVELDWIDLSSNQITDVEDYAFSGAIKLKTLMINENNMTIIRKATFAGAPSLQRLEVEKNQIEVVEEGAFDIQSLEILFFESNRVKQLPDSIFLNAPNLGTAYFSRNGMTEIGRAFYNLKKLSAVAFRNSSLKHVDIYGFIKSNPQMENMYMENSGFQFPNSIQQQEAFPNQLRCLFLTNNSILTNNFLEHLTPFNNLQILDIAFNNITQIDGIETVRQKFPKIVEIIYPGNPLSCKWLESTSFDRGLLTIRVYHKDLFNVSDYSVVDGILCKP